MWSSQDVWRLKIMICRRRFLAYFFFASLSNPLADVAIYVCMYIDVCCCSLMMMIICVAR